MFAASPAFFCNVVKLLVRIVGKFFFQHLGYEEKGRGGLYAKPPVMPFAVYPVAELQHFILSSGFPFVLRKERSCLERESLFHSLYVIEFLPSEKFNFNLLCFKISRFETLCHNLWLATHVAVRCCFAVDGVA